MNGGVVAGAARLERLVFDPFLFYTVRKSPRMFPTIGGLNSNRGECMLNMLGDGVTPSWH